MDSAEQQLLFLAISFGFGQRICCIDAPPETHHGTISYDHPKQGCRYAAKTGPTMEWTCLSSIRAAMLRVLIQAAQVLATTTLEQAAAQGLGIASTQLRCAALQCTSHSTAQL